MKTIKKQLLFLSVFAPLYIGTSLQAAMDEFLYLDAARELGTLAVTRLSPKKSSAPSKTSSPVTASSPNQPRNEKLSNFFSRLFNSKPTTESASAIATRQNELDPLGTTSPVATSSPQPKTHNSIVPSGTPESNLQITQGLTPARSKKEALTFHFNSPTRPSQNNTSVHFELTKEQFLQAIRLCQKNDITPPIFNGSAMQVSTTKTPSPVGDRSLWSENMNRKPAGTPFADNVSPLKNNNDGSFSLQFADGSFLLVEANRSITLHNEPTTPKSAKKDLFENTHVSSIHESSITEITAEGDNGTTTSADTSYSFEVDESPQAQHSKSEIKDNQHHEPMVLAKPLDQKTIREIARSLPPLKFPVMQKEWIATYTSTPVKTKAEQQQAVNGSQEVYSPAAKNVSSTLAAVHTLETENPEAFKKQIQQLRKEKQELSIALGFQEAKTRVALQKVEDLGEDNQALLQEYQKTATELQEQQKEAQAHQITSSLVHQAFMQAQTEIYTENMQQAAQKLTKQEQKTAEHSLNTQIASALLQDTVKAWNTAEKKLEKTYRGKQRVEEKYLETRAELKEKEAALRAQELETKKANTLAATLQDFNNNQKQRIEELVKKQSTFTHQCADTIDATVAWMKKNKIKTTLGVAAVTGLYGACWYKGRGTSLPFMNSLFAPALNNFTNTYGNPAISIVKNFCTTTFTKSATTTVQNGINTVPSILLNPFS